jgi:hypothetical protein
MKTTKQAIIITAPQKISGMLGIQRTQFFESHLMGIPLTQGKRHVPYCVLKIKSPSIERLSLPECEIDLPANLVSNLDKLAYKKALMLSSSSPCTAQQIKRIFKIAQGKPIYMVSLQPEFDMTGHHFKNPDGRAWANSSENPEPFSDDTPSTSASFLNQAGIKKHLNTDDEPQAVYVYPEVKASVNQEHFSSKEKLPCLSCVISLEDLQSEESIALQAGFEDYIQLTFSKGHPPTTEHVDAYINALRQVILKAQTNDIMIWFYCKTGPAATNLAQIMYDMMHNATNDTFEELIERSQFYLDLSHFGISISVPAHHSQTPEFYTEFLTIMNKNSSEKTRPQLAKLIFLRTFYDYAQQNPKGYPLTYSEFFSSSPMKEFFNQHVPLSPYQAGPLIQLRALF